MPARGALCSLQPRSAPHIRFPTIHRTTIRYWSGEDERRTMPRVTCRPPPVTTCRAAKNVPWKGTLAGPDLLTPEARHRLHFPGNRGRIFSLLVDYRGPWRDLPEKVLVAAIRVSPRLMTLTVLSIPSTTSILSGCGQPAKIACQHPSQSLGKQLQDRYTILPGRLDRLLTSVLRPCPFKVARECPRQLRY